MKSLEELKCSPAPWKLKKGPGGSEVHEGHGMLAFCGVSEIYSSDKGHYSFPHLANARLISAVPELYESLEEAQRETCWQCHGSEVPRGDEDCDQCIVAGWIEALKKAGGAE